MAILLSNSSHAALRFLARCHHAMISLRLRGLNVVVVAISFKLYYSVAIIVEFGRKTKFSFVFFNCFMAHKPMGINTSS